MPYFFLSTVVYAVISGDALIFLRPRVWRRRTTVNDLLSVSSQRATFMRVLGRHTGQSVYTQHRAPWRAQPSAAGPTMARASFGGIRLMRINGRQDIARRRDTSQSAWLVTFVARPVAPIQLLIELRMTSPNCGTAKRNESRTEQIQ